MDQNFPAILNHSSFIKNKLLQAIIAGLLHGFAYAPFNNIFAGFLSIGLLYFIVYQSKTIKNTIIQTIIFGTTYYIFSLHWVVNSLFLDIKSYWYLIPLALITIPFILSLYYLIVTIPIFYIKSYRYIIFPILWIIAEIAKSYLFTGFPWNLFGSIWLDYKSIAQIIYHTNIYFLSFLTLLMITSFIEVLIRKKGLVLFGSTISIFLIFALIPIKPIESGSPLKIRLVQPNIAQKFKWKYEELENILDKLVALSFNYTQFKPDLIVWPETAFPFIVDMDNLSKSEDHYLQYVTSHLLDNQYLVSGIIRTEGEKIFNSMISIDKFNKIIDFYDKRHLVPFGEFIPLRAWIKLKVISHFSDLSAGDNLKLAMDIRNDIKIHPLICYEGIFPYEIKNDSIKLIINITNDAWFGDSFGPYQHLRSVRAQAIKSGLPLIRVANNGITAIIDKYGVIVKQIDLGKTGVLDVELKI